MKSEVCKQFELELFNDVVQRHPIITASHGVSAFPKPKYQYNTANGLTRAIIDFIELHGGQAERISIAGRPHEVRNIAGRVCGVQWTKSHMTVGTADISATICGRSVKIEVKIGADRQSQAQKEYRRAVERAGGVYYIARDFDSFVSWFNSVKF